MKEVDPKNTKRAFSYEYFIDAPMPMVTIFKTIKVTPLLKLSKNGYKFNMLINYCIAQAANSIEEFFLLPVGKKLIQYDSIGVNVIVPNKNGGINYCDIPYSKDLGEFNRSYLELTRLVSERCENYEIENTMMVGTSSVVKYNIDGVINMYSGVFNNPFLIWGKYEDQGEDKIIKLSFQFHHVQMDGEEACLFLERIQENINNISLPNN